MGFGNINKQIRKNMNLDSYTDSTSSAGFNCIDLRLSSSSIHLQSLYYEKSIMNLYITYNYQNYLDVVSSRTRLINNGKLHFQITSYITKLQVSLCQVATIYWTATSVKFQVTDARQWNITKVWQVQYKPRSKVIFISSITPDIILLVKSQHLRQLTLCRILIYFALNVKVAWSSLKLGQIQFMASDLLLLGQTFGKPTETTSFQGDVRKASSDISSSQLFSQPRCNRLIKIFFYLNQLY